VIPFLTPFMLNKYVPPSEDLWLGIAVRDTCVVPQFKTSKKNKKPSDASKPNGYTFGFKGLDSFLLPYNRVTVPSFNLLQDAADNDTRKEVTGVSATNELVQVWTPQGRHKLTTALYSECARGLQPLAAVPLYDMALGTESKKRKETALRRNAKWLEEYIQKNKQDGHLVWAPIVLRMDGEDSTPVEGQQQDLVGVAFIGQEPGIDLTSQLKPHLNTVDKLPSTIALLSTLSTMEFIDAARAGVNMIGTALPAIWSKSKRAFVVEFNGDDEASNKRIKTSGEDGKECSGATEAILDSDGCIDMNDSKWARDSLPLTPGCSCMACSNSHSRAYIHHLVQAKELLAEILLFAHNLHHLRELCRALSGDVDGTYDAVTTRIRKAQK
jgi:queuine tRNA-ribosyltransferase subunit QTRTD1